MAILIKDCSEFFLGIFQRVENDNFRFVATNLSEFYSETIAESELLERVEDANTSVSITDIGKIEEKLSKSPDTSAITDKGDGGIQIELNYKIMASKCWKMIFDTKKASTEDRNAFINSIMKTALENNLMVSKMRRELEAKDAEIEDYKSNGAVLVRGALATAKFNFDHFRMSESIDPLNTLQSLNKILVKENLIDICQLMKLKNVTQNVIKSENLRNESKQSKIPTQPKKMLTKKEFSYVNADEGDDQIPATTSQVARSPRKRNINEASQKSKMDIKKFF